MNRRLFLVGLALAMSADDAKTAIRPSPLDAAFADGNSEEAAAKAILASPTFKRAVSEALKSRDARKAEVDRNPKGLTPAQSARVRFIEALAE